MKGVGMGWDGRLRRCILSVVVVEGGCCRVFGFGSGIRIRRVVGVWWSGGGRRGGLFGEVGCGRLGFGGIGKGGGRDVWRPFLLVRKECCAELFYLNFREQNRAMLRSY